MYERHERDDGNKYPYDLKRNYGPGILIRGIDAETDRTENIDELIGYAVTLYILKRDEDVSKDHKECTDPSCGTGEYLHEKYLLTKERSYLIKYHTIIIKANDHRS